MTSSTPLAPLTGDALAAALDTVPLWTERDGAIHRALRFANFAEAFGFMAEIAIVAESRNHHPEWSNVYSQVSITLTTHDAGGITELDFELARAIDSAASGRAD